MRLRNRDKSKSSSLDETDSNKRLGGGKKRKLDSSQTSQNDNVIKDKIKVPAPPVPENVQLIYMTRSVIEKLLMKPKSFEKKVKKTFVGIELPQKANSNRIDRQLVQVTGITKTSGHDGRISVKLQAKNMPNDISIDMVSDLDFSKILCKDLRQQVKDGLIEMPAVEELERMATTLSEVMVDDFISRETRRLQMKMDRANESGRRQEFFLLEYKRNALQTPGERLQLIQNYPTVTLEAEADDDNTMPENTNDTQEIKGANYEIGSGSRPMSQDMISGQEVKGSEGQGMKDNIEILSVADHSIVQSFAVESECHILQQYRQVEENRYDVMQEEFMNYDSKLRDKIDVLNRGVEENRYDVMQEEFKNYDNRLRDKIDEGKDKLNPPQLKLPTMEANINRIEQNIQQMAEKAQSIQSAAKLAGIQEKLDRIEQKIQQMAEKAQSTETSPELARIEETIDRIDQKIQKMMETTEVDRI